MFSTHMKIKSLMKREIKESKLICFSSKERRLYLLETKDLLILEWILGKDN